MHTTLLFRRLFYSSNVDIPVITSPLSQISVYQIIVLGILFGNRIYDSIAQNSPQTFGVLQALQVSTVLNSIIGHTTVGPQLPVSIIPGAILLASLCFHWRQALLQGRTASVFIFSSNTVVSIPFSQGIFLLNSHIHDNSGARGF